MEQQDHRRLGRELKLFHLQDDAAGSVFWHPRGHQLFRIIESYIRDKLSDYQEVKTPQLYDRSLWEKSGHWDKFQDNMYVFENEQRPFGLKPMNCPGHVQIFNSETVSYRQLPLRLAEFGCCHRSEPSGALHGIMRVRQFTQDDAHIFCEPNQVAEEVEKFINLLKGVYKDFGFHEVIVGLSTRPENRAGSDEDWDAAEHDLAHAVEGAGLEYELQPGEGAFYGPKLEFALKDRMGRQWQCGTIQLDMVLPKRLGATYVARDGSHKQPVMLHRAILGSIERFVGILLEHYEGNLPAWLAPENVAIVVLPGAEIYASKLSYEFQYNCQNINLRIIRDDSDDNLNTRIKRLSELKVNHIIVVGPRDAANMTVMIRDLGSNKPVSLSVEDAVNHIKASLRHR